MRRFVHKFVFNTRYSPVKVDNHIEDAVDADSQVSKVDEEDGEAKSAGAKKSAQKTHNQILPLLWLGSFLHLCLSVDFVFSHLKITRN